MERTKNIWQIAIMSRTHLESIHCLKFRLSLDHMWTQFLHWQKRVKSQVIYQFFSHLVMQFVGFLILPLLLMTGAHMLFKLQLILSRQNPFITFPAQNNTGQPSLLLSMLCHPNFFPIYLFPGPMMHRISKLDFHNTAISHEKHTLPIVF